jgi:hypothetical protein
MHNLYTFRAIAACISKKSKYPEKILGLSGGNKSEQQSQKVDNDPTGEIAARKFEDFITIFNKKFEKKQAEQESD